MSETTKPIDCNTAIDCSIYMTQRVEDQIDWMNKQSKKNKRFYFFIKAIEVISAALIPFLAIFNDKTNAVVSHNVNVATAALGVLIVILNGLQQLKKYYDNWIRYRNTAEQLLKEKFLFLTRTAPYNTADGYNKFVQNTESILGNENVKWISDMSQKQQDASGEDKGKKDG